MNSLAPLQITPLTTTQTEPNKVYILSYPELHLLKTKITQHREKYLPKSKIVNLSIEEVAHLYLETYMETDLIAPASETKVEINPETKA